MRARFGRLFAGRNRRGVAAILSGTALGQLIVAGFSPVLTRLYGPEAFALLSVFTAMTGISAIVMAARLEMAVPTAPTDAEARRIVAAALALCLTLSVLGSLICLLLGRWAQDVLGVPGVARWLWLMPWAGGFSAAYVVLTQWSVRVGAYSSIGWRNVIRAVFTVGPQVGAALAGLRLGGTVVGLSTGHAAGTVALLAGAKGLRVRDLVVGPRAMIPVLTERARFCAALTVSGLLNVAGTQAPILIFATAYTGDEVGFLGLTQRTLAIPVALIGASLMQVYVGQLSQHLREGKASDALFLRLTKVLAVIGVGGACVLVLAGEPLFAFVFGERWATAGEYARILAPAIALQLVAVPLSQTLILTGHTRLQVMWDIGRLVAVCGATVAAIAAGGTARQTLMAMSIAISLSYLAQWTVNFVAVRRPPRGLPAASSVPKA